MSPIKRPARQGAIVSLSQPDDYWRSRAAGHRKKGENKQAAALLRHAVSLHPQDDRLRLEYAQSLQALRCFESSNREAFEALSRNPQSVDSYAVIGRNMLALGREQEALDAYAYYMRLLKTAPENAVVDSDLEDVEDLFDQGPPERTARYDTRMRLAAEAIARGDMDGARYQLQRAQSLNQRDERLFTLASVLAIEDDEPKKALAAAQQAANFAPHSVQALCALACASDAAGDTRQADLALCKAATRCHYAHEEQLLCFTAAGLKLEKAALSMLLHNKKLNPDRLPTLYDLAVVLLHMGRMDDAAGYIHRCRELDPRDVPTQSLFRLIEQWQQKPDADAMTQTPFYPLLPPEETQRRLGALRDALNCDVADFAAALCENDELYDTFLYALSLPESGMERLLTVCAAILPKERAEALLRRVLVFPNAGDDVKRAASGLLLGMQAEPPFVVWHQGRIAQIAPAEPLRPVDKPLRRMLRLMELRHFSPALLTHTLGLLRRMSPEQRRLVAEDGATLWMQAFILHHQLSEAARTDASRAIAEMKDMPPMKHRVRGAVLALCDLAKGGSPYGNH